MEQEQEQAPPEIIENGPIFRRPYYRRRSFASSISSLEEGGERPVENTVIQPTTVASDLSGINICHYCNCLMEENQPKIELLCFHKYHTVCFLSTFYFGHEHLATDVQCKKCDNFVIINYYNDILENNRNIIKKKEREIKKKKKEDFKQEVLSNKELLDHLKIVKKSIREASSACTKFRKLGNHLGSDFREESHNLIELLNAMKKKYRERLLKSEEQQVYRKKKLRALYYLRVFNNKYRNFNFEKIISAKIPELKLPSRSTIFNSLYYPSWRLKRYFRIQF